MGDFQHTEMARYFFQRDIPKITKALENIDKELKRQNEINEKLLDIITKMNTINEDEA